MNHYLATFHTHLAALKTHRSLLKQGVTARMSPVPRKISSSCGTCVQYEAEHDCAACIDTDVEALYRIDGEEAELLKEYD